MSPPEKEEVKKPPPALKRDKPAPKEESKKPVATGKLSGKAATATAGG